MATIHPGSDLPLEPVEAGTGTRRQTLTARGSGAGFHMRRFVMEPGGGMPRHTNQVEHQQYVLKGSAQVGIGDQIYEVRAGDVVHIPAGEPHWYRASPDGPFEFLCAVPDDEDRIQVLDPAGG